MRSKWITLAVAGSLGAFVPAGARCADDNTSKSSSVAVAEYAERQRARELLRQATAELQAGRFEAARNLVKQAVETRATFGMFDLRPEHVLAEIERKERIAGATHSAGGAVSRPNALKGGPSPDAARSHDPAETNRKGRNFGDSRPIDRARTQPKSTPKPMIEEDAPSQRLVVIKSREQSAGTARSPLAALTEPDALPAAPSADDLQPHRLGELNPKERADVDTRPSVDAGSAPKSAQNQRIVGDVRPVDRERVATTGAAPDRSGSETPENTQESPDQVVQSERSTPQGLITRDKARAIELVDKGLVALDEKRYDDAERYARQAARLQVEWERYDYRPGHLLNEVRARKMYSASETTPISDSYFDGPQHAMKGASPSKSEHAASAHPRPSASALQAADEPKPARSTAPKVEASTRAEGSTPAAHGTKAEGSTAAHALRAQTLLEESLSALRAGNDDLAQRRLEQARQLIPGARPADATPKPTVRPAAAPGGAAKPTANATAASTGTRPEWISAGRPIQRSILPAGASGSDDSLKPLHDQFLGDDPMPTQRATPGEQKLRETLPKISPISPVYLPKRSAPTTAEEHAPPADDSASAIRAESTSPRREQPAHPLTRVQKTPDAPAISQQIDWLEKSSVPIAADGSPAAPPRRMPATAYQSGANPAPIAPPVAFDRKWAAAGRTPYATDPDPATSDKPEKPGFFRSMWNTLRGE